MAVKEVSENNSPKICPNCGHKSLHIIGGEQVCTECEFHTENKKPAKGSFR